MTFCVIFHRQTTPNLRIHFLNPCKIFVALHQIPLLSAFHKSFDLFIGVVHNLFGYQQLLSDPTDKWNLHILMWHGCIIYEPACTTPGACETHQLQRVKIASMTGLEHVTMVVHQDISISLFHLQPAKTQNNPSSSILRK